MDHGHGAISVTTFGAMRERAEKAEAEVARLRAALEQAKNSVADLIGYCHVPSILAAAHLTSVWSMLFHHRHQDYYHHRKGVTVTTTE